MTTPLRILGGLLMLYAVVYLAQLFLATIYASFLPAWDVLNYISAAGILAALIANFAYMRSQSGSEPLTAERAGAFALFYANAALAIWFLRNWIALLTEEAGESTPLDAEVFWHVIGVLIPLVLATTGYRLWRRGG